MTVLRAGQRTDCDFSIPKGARVYLFSNAPKLALKPTQLPYSQQWGFFPWAKAAGALSYQITQYSVETKKE
jgi:hypothetical protein